MGPGADWFADASDASDATDAPQHRQTIGVAIRVPEPFGPILQAKRAEFNDPLADSIPAHVTLLGTGTFRPVSDVVFVQVALGISGCERLEQRIRTGPYAADLTFPYHPHVTVAHDVAEADLDRAFDDLADFRADFEVAEIWLFEQDRLGQWRPVRSFPLTGPAPTR